VVETKERDLYEGRKERRLFFLHVKEGKGKGRKEETTLGFSHMETTATKLQTTNNKQKG
jgi:hypothetical protein